MRTPFIAGNWKMNKTIAETQALIAELRGALPAAESVEVAVCPPFVALAAAKAALAGSPIKLGAQNAHPEPKGAFTGEVSVTMLAGLVNYVIIGHSERRQLFGETDAFVNAKVLAVLAAGLKPILCVGETLAENEAGQTEAVLERQLREDLVNVSADAATQITIAYEPIWAIGTGRAATAADAQNRIAFIRAQLRQKYGAVADAVRIQYGGSVTAANAKEILSQPDIDGALVGGASLKAGDFAAIVAAAAR
jgi:triosephosphate isomerase